MTNRRRIDSEDARRSRGPLENRIVQYLAVGLILSLSLALTLTKRREAAAAASMEIMSRAWVAGQPLPSFRGLQNDSSLMSDASGPDSELRSMCETGRTLFVFVRAACNACARLESSWNQVALTRRDIRVVLAAVPVEDYVGDNGTLPRVSLTVDQYLAGFRTPDVPAAVVTGPNCLVERFGAGYTGSRRTLEALN